MTRRCHSPQAPLPDTYRGLYREDHPNPAEAYASEVKRVVSSAQEQGRQVTICMAPAQPTVNITSSVASWC